MAIQSNCILKILFTPIELAPLSSFVRRVSCSGHQSAERSTTGLSAQNTGFDCEFSAPFRASLPFETQRTLEEGRERRKGSRTGMSAVNAGFGPWHG